MTVGPIRLAFVAGQPAHYHAPFYGELARSEVFDLMVFFTDRELCERLHDPDMGALDPGIPRFEGYEWEIVDPPAGNSLVAGVRAAVQILRGDFDVAVLVALNHPASWLGLVASRLAGVVPIVKGEGDLLRGRTGTMAALKARLRRVFGSMVGCAIYSCSTNRDYFLDAGVDEDHLVFVPAAVDNEHYARKRRELPRQALRREHDLEDRVVFLFVGRLTARKRPRDLLEAAGQVDASRQEVVVVGDGPLRSRLEQRVSDRDHVTFTGTLPGEELVKWYQMADVLVLPSAWDPSPKVLNEAMNFENTCIVSDRVGSAHDLVRDGESGFLYPMGDVDVLADRMAKVAALAAEKRRKMGRLSRQIVADWTFSRGRRELEQHLIDHHVQDA